MDYHGQCVIDSTVICAFLEEKHPEQSIYPNNPSDKGSCLMLEDWSDEVLLNAILLIRWAENPEARIEGEKKLAIHLQSLDQFFNRKGFIFERLTIADMSIFTQLHYLYTVVKYEIPADYRDLHTWMDLMRKSLKLSSLYDLVV